MPRGSDESTIIRVFFLALIFRCMGPFLAHSSRTQGHMRVDLWTTQQPIQLSSLKSLRRHLYHGYFAW